MDKQIKDPNTNHQFLIMTLILSENQCHKFVRVAKEMNIREGIILLGKGTVNNTTLNLLGIKSQKKEVINLLLIKDKANEVLDYFSKELQLHEPGHGIAFTTPVLIASQTIDYKQDAFNTLQGVEGKRMFNKLTVVVNRGMAEDAMDIARKSGAKGGTIMHGRGTEHTAKVFGMEIEPEKELVMILLPSEILDEVVNSLYKELKLDVPGNGILFVEPIIEVRGLFD